MLATDLVKLESPELPCETAAGGPQLASCATCAWCAFAFWAAIFCSYKSVGLMVGRKVGSPSVPATIGIADGAGALGFPPLFGYRAACTTGVDISKEGAHLAVVAMVLAGGGGLGDGVMLL